MEWEELLERVEEKIKILINRMCEILKENELYPPACDILEDVFDISIAKDLLNPRLVYDVKRKKRREFMKMQKALRTLLRNRELIVKRLLKDMQGDLDVKEFPILEEREWKISIIRHGELDYSLLIESPYGRYEFALEFGDMKIFEAIAFWFNSEKRKYESLFRKLEGDQT